MARKKRNPMYISLTPQERQRLDDLCERERRGAVAQIMVMVDERWAELDPEYLAASKAAEE